MIASKLTVVKSLSGSLDSRSHWVRASATRESEGERVFSGGVFCGSEFGWPLDFIMKRGCLPVALVDFQARNSSGV